MAKKHFNLRTPCIANRCDLCYCLHFRSRLCRAVCSSGVRMWDRWRDCWKWKHTISSP